MFLSHFALGIEKQFPQSHYENEFLSEVLPVASSWKVSNEGKKVVSCWTSRQWKNQLVCSVSRYTNTDLLFSSEKVTAIICLGILFTKNLYHIEASQFICIANQLFGFQILQDFTESYFGTDYSYLVTMSFICSFNKN